MKKILPFLIGICCVGLTTLPLFQKGFFVPHDFTHAARIEEMNRSLLRGEFPVRWSENFGFGYGMPLFNFYAPLPYYIAQLPYAITRSAILSIKFLYLLSALLSFIGMYVLAKKIWGESGGLLSAVVYSFANYRALDMYVRGDIGELFAMAFLPFTLLGLFHIARQPKRGILITGTSYALILLSHNLSGMIAGVLLVFFGLVSLRIEKNNRLIFPMGVAGMLAVFLSAFYTIPSFAEKNFTRVEQTITTGYFDYHNHFVALRQFLFGTWGYGGSVPGLEDGISFALGWVPITLLSLSFFFFIFTYFKKNAAYPASPVGGQIAYAKYYILSLFLLGGCLFMSTTKSVAIWDHITVLKYMQFPWRFLEFAHVFLALSIGAFMRWIPKTYAFPTIAIVFVALVFTQQRYFQPEKYLQEPELSKYYSTDPAFIRENLSKTLNDYLPPAIHDDAFPVPVEKRFEQDGNTVHVNVFQFPGWVGIVDGKKVPLTPDPQFPTYNLTLERQTSSYSVQLEDTALRRMSNILSLIGVGLSLWILWMPYGRIRT